MDLSCFFLRFRLSDLFPIGSYSVMTTQILYKFEVAGGVSDETECG